MTYETAAPETQNYAHEASSASVVSHESVGRRHRAHRHATIDTSLLAHMRRLRKQNQGMSRWLALAVLAGSVVAFAVVNFLAR